ncbi:MAG: hypothetical protein J6V98_07170 [Bacteroidales bacterium]|nr:hypothetical protein [Bacteroidales bacterium]
MKKVLFTAMAAVAVFALVACNNKKVEEPVAEECAAVEACEHHCAMDSTCCADQCMCSEECKAANCEACPNHGTENCCKAKAAVEGQACEKACEHKCEKAEAKECEKACEKKCDKPCEKKCEKAQ